MLDHEGFRPNVGIILCNNKNEVFWGKRVREHTWQFPQGGIQKGESPKEAMYRELNEELGLHPEHVLILGRTKSWLRYEVPKNWIRRDWRHIFRGQKQIWYLLRLLGGDHLINLRANSKPEFDAWRWQNYWVPLESVIDFKRSVYESALLELVQRLTRDAKNYRARLLARSVFTSPLRYDLMALNRRQSQLSQTAHTLLPPDLHSPQSRFA